MDSIWGVHFSASRSSANEDYSDYIVAINMIPSRIHTLFPDTHDMNYAERERGSEWH